MIIEEIYHVDPITIYKINGITFSINGSLPLHNPTLPPLNIIIKITIEG